MNDLTTIDNLSGVEVAAGAAGDLKDRHANARRAVAEFALRALIDGVPVERMASAA